MVSSSLADILRTVEALEAAAMQQALDLGVLRQTLTNQIKEEG